jgi:hypothetical protein
MGRDAKAAGQRRAGLVMRLRVRVGRETVIEDTLAWLGLVITAFSRNPTFAAETT